MRAIHVSVRVAPPVRGALSHGDQWELRLSKFFIIIVGVLLLFNLAVNSYRIREARNVYMYTQLKRNSHR